MTNTSSQRLPVSSTRVELLIDDNTDVKYVEYNEGEVDKAALFGVIPARTNKARKLNRTSQDGIIDIRIKKERNLLATKGRRYGNYTVPIPGQPVIGIDKPTIESQETIRGDEIIEVNPTKPPAPVSKKVRFSPQQNGPQKLAKAV